jgi:hypothetical protein
MINFFKTKNRLYLDKPNNQKAEILFELINQNYATRLDLMQMTGCLNITAIISKLRLDHEIEIKCNFRDVFNKHGRPVKFGVYNLIDKGDALSKYNSINKR